MAAKAEAALSNGAPSDQRLVIAGASLGTLFEWYDFFLYGVLASEIARRFFQDAGETTGFILTLAAFGAGFAVRPLGAVLFGRIGDIVGRKNTFIATITIMGASTFLIGVLPDYQTIGTAAPVLLVALRLLQGLSVGGEYGGAAIYVAEHARKERRGLDTSWVNMAGTCGLVLALLVIIACRAAVPGEAFEQWGWRLPFLLSALLLAVSLWVRLKLGESPVFQRMKDEGVVSQAPFAEAFGRWENLKYVLVVLIGLIAGATTVWYTAHFYTLYFLERTLKLDALTVNLLMAIALAIAAPAFLVVGWLSDRIGRKPIMVAGCALGALTIVPLFHLLTEAANPALAAAQRAAPVVVFADPSACSVQFDPLGRRRFDERGCDVAKDFLTRAGVSYRTKDLPRGATTEVHVGERVVRSPDLGGLNAEPRAQAIDAFRAEARAALASVGYPGKADPARLDAPLAIVIVVFLAVLAAMVYAPMAAYLVELFPARIRYTSLSLPYHLGVGWIGGFLPATAFAIVAATGDLYAGLWYPVAFCAVSALAGALLLPETRGKEI
jgi:MFS family permease